MKKSQSLLLFAFSLLFIQANAQSEAPKGFKKGTIVLSDGSSLSGSVKDNMRSNASIMFMDQSGSNKKKYSGSELLSTEIDGEKFLCISGDFFKVLCQGELNFLQKSSDASSKPVYNGNEAVFSNGTEGKPGDYFLYSTANKELKLVSKRNMDEVIKTSFQNHTAAIDKAKTVNGDLSQLKDAVEIYNKRNSN